MVTLDRLTQVFIDCECLSHLIFVFSLVQGKPGKDGDPGNSGFPVSLSVSQFFTGMCFSLLIKMFNMHLYSLFPDRVPKEIQAFQGLPAEMEREYVFFCFF